MNIHENHFFDDPELPIIFHNTILNNGRSISISNWHENLEIFVIRHGTGYIQIDGRYIPAEPDDIIVVNSNRLHSAVSESPEIGYYCLIIDRDFCSRFGLHTSDVVIQEKINDPVILNSICSIHRELCGKKPYFRAAVMQDVLTILLRLFREYLEPDFQENTQGKNTAMVKKAIMYMKLHCCENISVTDISDYVGYSKFYFCRSFKQITGHTVNTYLNSLKIQQANTYLKQGKLSVGDVAVKCGFDNISYFTKIFKKYTGHLPSAVLGRKS